MSHAQAVVRVNSRRMVGGLLLGAVSSGVFWYLSPDWLTLLSVFATGLVATFATISIAIVPFTDRDRGAELIERLQGVVDRLTKWRTERTEELMAYGFPAGMFGGFTLAGLFLNAVFSAEPAEKWLRAAEICGPIFGFFLAVLLASLGAGQAPSRSRDGGEVSEEDAPEGTH